jgi:hypothetical protein
MWIITCGFITESYESIRPGSWAWNFPLLNTFLKELCYKSGLDPRCILIVITTMVTPMLWCAFIMNIIQKGPRKRWKMRHSSTLRNVNFSTHPVTFESRTVRYFMYFRKEGKVMKIHFVIFNFIKKFSFKWT